MIKSMVVGFLVRQSQKNHRVEVSVNVVVEKIITVVSVALVTTTRVINVEKKGLFAYIL